MAKDKEWTRKLAKVLNAGKAEDARIRLQVLGDEEDYDFLEDDDDDDIVVIRGKDGSRNLVRRRRRKKKRVKRDYTSKNNVFDLSIEEVAHGLCQADDEEDSDEEDGPISFEKAASNEAKSLGRSLLRGAATGGLIGGFRATTKVFRKLGIL